MDPKVLQQTILEAEQAKLTGAERRQQEANALQAQREAEERQRECERILAQIPTAVRKARVEGTNLVWAHTVPVVEYRDDGYPPRPQNLAGVSALVWKSLLEANLHPGLASRPRSWEGKGNVDILLDRSSLKP